MAISNITYVVGIVYNGNFEEVESFDNVEDAVHTCQNWNENDTSNVYEIHVEFDAD